MNDGPFVILAIASNLRGLAAFALVLAALGALGLAAVAFGVDSRDGPDW